MHQTRTLKDYELLHQIEIVHAIVVLFNFNISYRSTLATTDVLKFTVAHSCRLFWKRKGNLLVTTTFTVAHLGFDKGSSTCFVSRSARLLTQIRCPLSFPLRLAQKLTKPSRFYHRRTSCYRSNHSRQSQLHTG